MSNSAGRDLLLKKNGTTIASLTATSIRWQGQPIDVTNKDSAGVQEFLADKFASESLELGVEGFTDDDVLSDIGFGTTAGAKHLSDITLARPNGDVVSGTFILTNYEERGGHDDGVTFTATLVRSGAHTFTQA